jgi:hypothetical protein
MTTEMRMMGRAIERSLCAFEPSSTGCCCGGGLDLLASVSVVDEGVAMLDGDDDAKEGGPEVGDADAGLDADE